MTQTPSADEWDFSNLPAERRDYLEINVALKEIARRLAEEAACAFGKIDPLLNGAPGAPALTTRRAWFKVTVDRQTADLFYNGRDGLRGRYWQSAAAGEAATRCLIAALKPKLLGYMLDHPECMTSPDAGKQSIGNIELSLDASSAKLWAHEKKGQDFNEGPKVLVRRWAKRSPGGHWRWAPQGPLIDIKGAFFTPADREHLTKPNRSRDIHEEGFS